MRLHRFFTPLHIEEGKINSIPDLVVIHQMMKVLRLQIGNGVVFFDGSGNEYQSEIVSLDKDAVKFHIIKTNKVKIHSSLKLSLAFSLIKKDNVEWIIQKCTELGVSEFIPLVSERSEKKGFNLERAQKIAVEASEQSGRGDIPKIHEPKTLAEFLAIEKREIVAFHTKGNNFEKENLSEFPDSNLNPKSSELVACIGPEGGWSEKEISMFGEKGASIITLNTPILRAETAAVAVTTLLLVE